MLINLNKLIRMNHDFLFIYRITIYRNAAGYEADVESEFVVFSIPCQNLENTLRANKN